MRIEKDFKEFIELLNKNEVRYLVVGGYAFSFHAEPRFTKGLDFFIDTSDENASRLMAALAELGFGDTGLKVEDFKKPGVVVQLGNAPVRIDIVTSIDGVTFEPAWSNRVIGDFGGAPTSFISKEDLRKNKLASGRKQDLADLEKLEKI